MSVQSCWFSRLLRTTLVRASVWEEITISRIVRYVSSCWKIGHEDAWLKVSL